MDRPLVSVVIPTYTAPGAALRPSEKLLRCLVSFFMQPYKPIEVVLVDDGTPSEYNQELAEVLAAIYRNLTPDQHLKFYATDNRGQAAAFNFGNRQAKGKYIMPFNDDDIVCATFITKAVEYMEAHPDVGFVYGDYMHTPNMNDMYTFKRALPPPIQWTPAALREIQICPVIGLYRADVVRQVEWDEGLGHEEDWDYLLRIARVTKGYYMPLTYSFVIHTHEDQKSIADAEGVQACRDLIRQRIKAGYYD